VLEANGAAGHHGPESCYHVSGLIHAASVLATAPAPPWSPRHRSLRTGDAPGTPAAAIDLLFLAPKLPPPPSRQI